MWHPPPLRDLVAMCMQAGECWGLALHIGAFNLVANFQLGLASLSLSTHLCWLCPVSDQLNMRDRQGNCEWIRWPGWSISHIFMASLGHWGNGWLQRDGWSCLVRTCRGSWHVILLTDQPVCLLEPASLSSESSSRSRRSTCAESCNSLVGKLGQFHHHCLAVGACLLKLLLWTNVKVLNALVMSYLWQCLSLRYSAPSHLQETTLNKFFRNSPVWPQKFFCTSLYIAWYL